MTTVHHRCATVSEGRLFYREAGSEDAAALVLLHGFPTSSFMFRHLIPKLADRYRVIAPDHFGFGLSDAPPTNEYYSFDSLADLTQSLLAQLGVSRYAMYVHDYGAPIGWRLALADPESVSAIITQNGNGYEAGFEQVFWKPVRDYWNHQSAQTEAGVRQALSLDAIRWQYLHGVPDPSVVAPDTWFHDHALVSRPGNDGCSYSCSWTTPTICPCTRSCTPTSATAAFPSWPCGVVTIRSLDRLAPWRSAMTPQPPRSTCSTAATSSWKAISTPPSATSGDP